MWNPRSVSRPTGNEDRDSPDKYCIIWSTVLFSTNNTQWSSIMMYMQLDYHQRTLRKWTMLLATYTGLFKIMWLLAWTLHFRQLGIILQYRLCCVCDHSAMWDVMQWMVGHKNCQHNSCYSIVPVQIHRSDIISCDTYCVALWYLYSRCP